MKQINKTILTICGVLIAYIIIYSLYIIFCLCLINERIFMLVKFINVILLVINFILIVANIKMWYDKTKDGLKDRLFGSDGKGLQI